MRLVKVLSLDDISDIVIPDGFSNWTDYWMNETGRELTGCQRLLCQDKEKIEAVPVKILGDESTYIVPLCKNCAGSKTEYNVKVWLNDLAEVR